MGARDATEMDRMIGQRIRLARKVVKLSQTTLAQGIGVTYQQVQKYENGTDRISAGRLFQVMQMTDQPVSFFFGLDEADSDASGTDFLADPHMQKLIAFAAELHSKDLLGQLARVAETFAADETRHD